MEKRLLDVTGCKYLGELHLRIRDTFAFPYFYGENLDGLWDMGMDYIAMAGPFVVEIVGTNTLPKDLKVYFDSEIMGVFYEIERISEDFSKDIKFQIIS